MKPAAGVAVLNIQLGKIVDALRPFGPTPIVAVVIGVASLGALAAGASAIAVALIDFLVFGVHIWAQERKALWLQRELEVKFDHDLRIRAANAVDRLEKRSNASAKRPPRNGGSK